jgi:hypothetical protein
MTATEAPEWPSDRGSYTGIILQFGRTRADLLQWALGTADPLADAVVEEMHELGRGVRAQWGAATKQLLGQADPVLYESAG